MTNEELNDLIAKLESETSMEKAIFEIRKIDVEESFVKANKEGLQIFALELLKASAQAEQAAMKNQLIHFENLELLENGDICPYYIEPTLEIRQTRIPEPLRKETWKDKLTTGGCVTVLLILITATIVGLISILKWAF